MDGLLQGVTVLDLTRVLAGPYCAMLLSDMGAKVIKLEQSGVGDDSRAMGPYVNGQSVYYVNFNRGKLGCTLNLKAPEGRELFLRMVKTADVVLENYRPGTMEKLGIGYETLREINPGLVFASVSGFGQKGPYAAQPGYDIIGQAASGLMSVTGWPDTPPTRVGTTAGDIMGGLNMTIGVLAALYRRQATGQGERIDIALTDGLVSALTNINMIYLSTGRVPGRIGNRYEATYPYDVFPTQDGNIVIGCGNNRLFAALCRTMGREDLIEDARFQMPELRVTNHEPLGEIISAWTTSIPTEELEQRLKEAGIPTTAVNTLADTAADPHIAGARNMFPTIDQPGIGPMRVTNNALRFDSMPSNPTAHAPALGEHNALVYREFLDEDTLEDYIQRGII